ncbi:hypothetical protein C8R45DRAFT_1006039, partial [Mycena sanguinolenta]
MSLSSTASRHHVALHFPLFFHLGVSLYRGFLLPLLCFALATFLESLCLVSTLFTGFPENNGKYRFLF